MGGAVSAGAAVGDAAGAATYPVTLNVYDLTPINNYLHWCGLGIFHSAVEGERQARNGDSFRRGFFRFREEWVRRSYCSFEITIRFSFYRNSCFYSMKKRVSLSDQQDLRFGFDNCLN